MYLKTSFSVDRQRLAYMFEQILSSVFVLVLNLMNYYDGYFGSELLFFVCVVFMLVFRVCVYVCLILQFF